MCAISGIIGLEAGEEGIQRMLATMARRGPDGSGIYRGNGGVLLHTRLAVIDPAGGSQPMLFTQNGETYAIVYNGELYNTEELRQELQSLGHRFEGYSDTEVLLHSFVQWKEGCLEKLNGIYAFAVWLQREQRLFLARDRIGVKPLFWKEHGGGLLFGSEIKTVLAYPGVKAELDEEGAAQLLLLGPGRMPGSGVFLGVRELEPGCWAEYRQGRLTEHRYWRLRDREHTDSFEETVEKVRFLVTDAIRRQLVSDVPLGCFLSGGLDSSIISAVAAREFAREGKPLDTFSIGYQGEERFFRAGKFQPTSDRDYIRLMAEFLGSRSHKWELTPEELVEALEDATLARDLPGMADVDFSLLLFCKRIREDVTVALSGECADEIFGGYPWYRDPEVRSRSGFPWAQNTQERAALPIAALSDRLDPEEFVMDAYRKTCLESDILPEASPQERRMKEMVNLNFRWFMQTLLDRKDRMSMYWGLEVRVPFCDYRIAEYHYAVPWEYKDYLVEEKGLLRAAMGDILPQSVAHRKKSPYPKTFDPKYEAILQARMNQILGQKDAPLFSLVDKEALRELLNGESLWPWYGQLMRRPQILAYFLQMDFWLRHYHVDLTYL